MAKKQTYNLIFIIVVSVVTVAICGSLIGHLVYYNNDKEEILKISEDGFAEEIIVSNFENFKPGSKEKYSLKIESLEESAYIINLNFSELKDGTLKKYLNVLIKANGELICEKNLEELLNSEIPVSFENIIKPNDLLELEIQYEMPISVGNEAQNTETSVKVEITISQKE